MGEDDWVFGGLCVMVNICVLCQLRESDRNCLELLRIHLELHSPFPLVVDPGCVPLGACAGDMCANTHGSSDALLLNEIDC